MSNRRSFIHRGAEGVNRVDGELEKQKARMEGRGKGNVFRFYMKDGETKQYAILDDKPDCFMYEHTIKDPATGKWGFTLGCVKEYDSCAICEEYAESVYTMFFTILDFTEFTDKKGNVHTFSRKLLAVKPSQQKKFIRFYNREGTLRGAIFEASRDGKMSASIGNEHEFLEFMSEEELENDYTRSWVDRDGKEHIENQAEVYKYEDIFEEPNAEKFRAMVGASAPLGSADQQKKDMGDGWDDDEPLEVDSDTEDTDEDNESRGSSRGGRSSSRGTSHRRSGRSSRVQKEDSEDEDSDSGGRANRRARRSR